MKHGIATKEQELYSSVWASIDDYELYSPGETYLPLFLDMIGETRGSILDAGCGSGKGAIALKAAGFDVTMCDMTAEGLVPEAQDIPFTFRVLWHPSKQQYDFAYCCDVLEHIPPQFPMLVVSRLLEAAPRVFLSVCNVQDSAGVWIGKTLHQTVQPFTWWRDSFRELATVVECRDLFDNSVFLLERK
jgi:2-polyprenyl-3-methyl-5-hydroxy-6-metoxy-1,4-benzoquinol methylase